MFVKKCTLNFLYWKLSNFTLITLGLIILVSEKVVSKQRFLNSKFRGSFVYVEWMIGEGLSVESRHKLTEEKIKGKDRNRERRMKRLRYMFGTFFR